jgi:hypothetical protein
VTIPTYCTMPTYVLINTSAKLESASNILNLGNIPFRSGYRLFCYLYCGLSSVLGLLASVMDFQTLINDCFACFCLILTLMKNRMTFSSKSKYWICKRDINTKIKDNINAR